jgi:tetratricopeptide (TPR) repeat protein
MVKCNVRRKSRAPKNAAELIEEGFRCYEQGDKPGAEKKLRAACAIRPPVPQAHYNLGYFYNLEGRWDEAEKALLEALEHQPDYSRALFTLASVYMDAGRLDRAQAKFLATERLTPEDLDIQLNLGILAIRAGRSEEALDRLNRCIEAEHSADAARFHRATALQDLGRLDEALVLYRALVAAGSDWRQPVLNAIVTRSKGRFPLSQSKLAEMLGL